MQKKEILNCFKAVCSAFPSASIAIVDSHHKIIHGQSITKFPWSPVHFTNKLESDTITIKENSFYQIGVPIFKENQIWILIPSTIFPDIYTLIKMVNGVLNIILEVPSSSLENKKSQFQGDLRLFFDHLFLTSSNDHYTYATLLATNLDIDLSIDRLVCIIDLEILTSFNIFAYINTLKRVLKIKEQDIIGPIDSTKIVYCPCIDLLSYRKEILSQDLEHCVNQIQQIYHHNIRIGVGLFVKDVSEYGYSFLIAQKTLQIFSKQLERNIEFSDDYIFERILEYIPQYKLEHFLTPIHDILSQYPLLLMTIEALIKNDMDLYSAASYLQIHRNTVVYRLQKIKQIMAINPLHSDNDRMLIHLLFRFSQQETECP